MLRFIASLLFLALPIVVFGAIDPDTLSKLKKGQTSQQVKDTLGSPTSEDHNPDGRFVYVYEYQSAKDPTEKGYATLLFGKDKRLQQLQAYKTTGSSK